MLVYGGGEVWHNKNDHSIMTNESPNIAKHEIINVDITLEERQVIVNHMKWKGTKHTGSSQNLSRLKIEDTNHTTKVTQNFYEHHTQ